MPEKLRLSYTKMDFYITCPKRYYYRYVEKKPYYPSYKTKFGSNLHRALKNVTEIIKSKGAIDNESQKELFEKQWSDVSKDKDKNQQLKNKGELQLKLFSETNLTAIQNTLFIEKSFSCKLDNITLCGYIDRVDVIKDKYVEIIDYKTGNLRILYPDDLQLNFYALICRDFLDLIPAKLSLYFLKTNEKLSVNVENQCIDMTKSLILNVSEKILSNYYIPTEHPLDHCPECCYNKICPDFIKLIN
ncbi:MAG: PD-(D/E)XK nuclease family protein [Candidatus Gastranaerophilales bacterium]|nr:PD-(D/E)XK nuclease family protein [Candidatus Gastranaerophilales bacterium]